MNPKKKVVMLWAATLLVALAKGYVTCLNTPDLNGEGNLLVAVLGLGGGARSGSFGK